MAIVIDPPPNDDDEDDESGAEPQPEPQPVKGSPLTAEFAEVFVEKQLG